MKIIAHIRTDFPDKFGLPRQSMLAENLMGHIVFEDAYRDERAVEGLMDYDYLWILWKFEGVESDEFRPQVRPPRLGGNTYKGVFATRSPFRPNPIGLSCVKLEAVKQSEDGPVILVSGIDMRDNTPIYDIKPYLPYVDAHPQARGGFTDVTKSYALEVSDPEQLLVAVPEDMQSGLVQALSQDPRPAYQADPDRVYGMRFNQWEVKFRVEGEHLIICGIL